MRKENRRWKVKGSYTVEAALLMPLLLGVCFAIILAGFVMHDRIIIGNALQEICQRDEMIKVAKDGAEGKMQLEKVQEKIEEKCMVLRLQSLSVVVKKRKIKASAKVQMGAEEMFGGWWLKKLNSQTFACKRDIEQIAAYMRRNRNEQTENREDG